MVRGLYKYVLCLIGVSGLLAATARAETPNYVDFFTANGNSFEAYLDLNNQSIDGSGYKLVNVKIGTISEAFRSWIKTNFPGGETADYAIDPYSVDCTNKTVGEHRIVFYDANGLPLTNYDFGGHMAPPIGGSMKDEMMKKVCGI